MRKFLLSLLLLAVFSPLALRADEVIVGTADLEPTHVVPFKTNSAATYSQTIYPKDKIGKAMSIASLAFNCATPNVTTTANIKLYVGETSQESLDNSSGWVQNLTLVFDGPVTLGGEEWENFTFTAPYEYSGTQNLVVAVSVSNCVTTTDLKWNVQNVSSSCMHNNQADSEPQLFRSVKSRMTVIKLSSESGETPEPENPTPENPEQPEVPTLDDLVVAATATNATTIALSWNAVADSALYQVYFGTEYLGETYETSYIVNNCIPEKMHCFTVKATKDGAQKETMACATTPAQGEEPENPTPENPQPEQPSSTSVAFYDNFNDFKYTERWIRTDKDGDGYNWSSIQNGSYAGYEDTYGLYSACYMSGQALTPDNYIYTKAKYIITETSALSFLHRVSDPEYYEETFSIVISEDGENFETVWTKKYTENDVLADEEWNYDSISLAAYVGKTVYVGFRHHDSKGNTAKGIKIDNVRLSTAEDDGEVEEPENPTPDFPIGDAETVVIGEDGTFSSYNVPINDYFNSFGVSQMIYTAEEIGVKDGTIISISFKSDVVGNVEREIAVYLKNTDKEYYTAESDWITLTAEDVAVFEGDITTPSTSGWFTINFNRPFEYTGGNLAVTINDITGGYELDGDSWCSYATENPRAMYSTSYSTPIDHLALESKLGSLDKGKDSNQYINSQIKFDIIPAPASIVAPESIDFGRLAIGEYWSEKTLNVNIKAVNTEITSLSIDNDFFILPEVKLPATNLELAISYDKNSYAAQRIGDLFIGYEDTVKVVTLTALSYEPSSPDLFELAQKVEFTENAFTHTPDFSKIYDSYILPEETVDGNAPDAVYEVEFTSDVLLSANVTGTNAMLAVYKSDFDGIGGPSANNSYNGISYTPRNFSFDFNDGTFKGWTLIDNDGNGYNWNVVNEDGEKFVKSFAEKKQGTGEQEVTIITEADNVMMTEGLYNITANSKLSFDASRYSSGDEGLDNSETYKEYVFVEVSKDGKTFTTIEKTLPTAGVFGNIVVDLGAKFAELGLSYGDYHIALHHNENDGVYVSVDNIKLANVKTSKTAAKSIEDVHYPAGKYYVVAAAESEFTVSISTKEAPLTPPTEIYVTEITTTTAKLTWDAVAKAESYNVYRGSSLVANVKDTEYTIENLQAFTSYSFVIKSVAGEEESSASETIVFKTKDLEVTMPTNLAIAAIDETSITLKWDAVENALSYNVYSSDKVFATVATTTYTITGLEAETLYCYSVSAVRNETESEKTEEVCGTTGNLAPGAPTELVAEIIDMTTIALRWTAGLHATGYNIYRDGEKIGESTGTLYVDRDLVQGTEYCYTVKGVRGIVESVGESNQACATTGGVKPIPPVTPTNLIVTGVSTSSVKLVWGAISNALSYNVYRGEELITTTELPQCTIDSLEYNTEYCFTVTAVNEIGESEKSVEACGKTLDDGIEELTSSISVYPNPVSDKLYIETEVEIEEVSIFDIYGRRQELSAVSCQPSSIDVSGLNSGVYFVKIVTANGEAVQRFIKK